MCALFTVGEPVEGLVCTTSPHGSGKECWGPWKEDAIDVKFKKGVIIAVPSADKSNADKHRVRFDDNAIGTHVLERQHIRAQKLREGGEVICVAKRGDSEKPAKIDGRVPLKSCTKCFGTLRRNKMKKKGVDYVGDYGGKCVLCSWKGGLKERPSSELSPRNYA